MLQMYIVFSPSDMQVFNVGRQVYKRVGRDLKGYARIYRGMKYIGMFSFGYRGKGFRGLGRGLRIFGLGALESHY